MSESSVKLLCVVVGAAAIIAIWPLLAGMSLRPSLGLLLVLGVVSGLAVSAAGAKRLASLARLWLGALLGGLAQWVIHAAQFPGDAYNFGFNLVLALAIVLFAALAMTAGYLLALIAGFLVGKLRA